MKKLLYLGMALLFAVTLNAQNRKVTSAWNYLKDDYLDDAKKAIDEAEQNPETAESYKTFWYKGKIYQAIGSSKNKKYKALCNDCYEVAYDSYMKALKYNFKKPEHRSIDFTTQVGLMQFGKIMNEQNESYFENTETFMDIFFQQFPALSNAFVNKGIAEFQASNFEGSYAQFKKAIEISTLTFKVDTQIFYYASLAAINSKKYEDAISLNDFLISVNYGADNKEKVNVYQNQIRALKETGDTAKLTKIIDKGIEKFPQDNYPLVIEAFNYYVSAQQNDKAAEYIDLAIKADPTNAGFYVIRATLLQQTDKQKAEQDYLKAFELDANNYEVLYGIGAFYINTAADSLKWAEDNIPPQNFDEFEKYQNLAKDYQLKAVPYLEKARVIKPNDLQILQILKEIYYKTGKFEESQAIGEEIKKLTE